MMVNFGGRLLLAAATLLALAGTGGAVVATTVDDEDDMPPATLAALVNGRVVRNGEDNAVDDCKLSPPQRSRWDVTRAIERVREKWFWKEAEWLKSDAGRPGLGAVFADVESNVPDHPDKIHEWFMGFQGVAENEIMEAVAGGSSPIFSSQTDFQHVEIGNSRLKSGGQYLKLDGHLQSSSADEALYHESIIHQAMVAHPNPKRVLIGGGGEGANLREVLKYSSVEKVLMVDIDEKFVKMCQEHLGTYHVGSFDDPRVEVRFGDAREYMMSAGGALQAAKSFLQGLFRKGKTNNTGKGKAAKERWDVIILDFPDFLPRDNGYELGQLYSREFYSAVRDRLAPGGVMLAQGGSFEMAAVRRTLNHIFAHVGLSFTIMFTYPVQTWFIASDLVDISELNGEEVDKRLRDRIGAEAAAELKWYGGEVHDRMFALGSEIAEGGFFDRHDCILVDRVAGLDGDEDVDDSEDDSEDSEDDSEDDEEVPRPVGVPYAEPPPSPGADSKDKVDGSEL